ncbi:poly(A)-specific ribonuclease [Elasticomyces elasticus]|nr:poly(A)-specific ribonuclease [Elasticomyces elasticus]
MEADWSEVTRIPLPPPAPNAYLTPVTTFAFDSHQELLWAGNDHVNISSLISVLQIRDLLTVVQGRVSSFFGRDLSRYTSYRAGSAEDGAIKKLLFCDKGVVSISARTVHLSIRRGLTQWHLKHPGFLNLQCMAFTSKGVQEVLIAGLQSQMFKVDVEKGVVTDTIEAEAHYTIMKRAGQYICAGTPNGAIHVLDPATCRVVKNWQAHAGWINDMDASASFLVTCGGSPRPLYGPTLDPLARVYDLKTLLPLPPITFQAGAAFIRMHPKMSSTCIICSQNGQLQVVDLLQSVMVSVHQANIYDTYLTALELAPSGEALVLADTQCQIHLWGSPTKMRFSELNIAPEFPDVPAPVPSLPWSTEIPLSTIGMPFYREVLLSAWPSHVSYTVGAPPPKIDPEILASLKRSDIGGHAPWPRKTRRYQVEDNRAVQQAKDTLAVPRFLSERLQSDPEIQNGQRRISDALESLADLALSGSTKKDVPVVYQNFEIKYSKFGVEDFDFEYYNRTSYSGLETHIANSYMNSLLQVLRFTPIIRNLALRHTASSCLYETCLLCEMGFLFDMLEKAEGQNCQATNFLKTFSSLSLAATLGLLEDLSPNTPLTVMIQSVNRFLMGKISVDYRQISPQVNHLETALATVAIESTRCTFCTSEQSLPDRQLVHDLVYPSKAVRQSPRAPRPTFSTILKTSIDNHTQSKGWCGKCHRYQLLSKTKNMQGLPSVLMINTAIHNPEARQLWATPGWLPQQIGVIINSGQIFCYEGKDLTLHLARGAHNITVYELIGVVADINSGENQKPHLVSLINVAPSSINAQDKDLWHLFNDFLVRPTTTNEALRFDVGWKLPSLLTYQVLSGSHRIDDTWKENLDPSLLYRKWSQFENANPDTFRLLSDDTERPKLGFQCAIDAEFVKLEREEIDLHSDGTHETVRPSRLGLARVSVLRGAGNDAGLPFIDDYIAINEVVVDYLTAFSGISPGDLDRMTSKHALVSLKVAYKKLWLLLNLGCIFIGHGLPKDFRTINIHVPKSQVIDTVDLFYISANKRKLSLRFLAWYLLKEEIQQTTHDSVEDARTALKLYAKYKEFVDAGILEPMLNEIYAKGREVGFKAPSAVAGLGVEALGTPGGSATASPSKKSAALARTTLGSSLR